MADWMDELERLTKLRDQGAVDEEEFKVLKEKIIQSPLPRQFPEEKFQKGGEISWPPQGESKFANSNNNHDYGIYDYETLFPNGEYREFYSLKELTAMSPENLEELCKRLKEAGHSETVAEPKSIFQFMSRERRKDISPLSFPDPTEIESKETKSKLNAILTHILYYLIIPCLTIGILFSIALPVLTDPTAEGNLGWLKTGGLGAAIYLIVYFWGLFVRGLWVSLKNSAPERIVFPDGSKAPPGTIRRPQIVCQHCRQSGFVYQIGRTKQRQDTTREGIIFGLPTWQKEINALCWNCKLEFTVKGGSSLGL